MFHLERISNIIWMDYKLKELEFILLNIKEHQNSIQLSSTNDNFTYIIYLFASYYP